MKTIEHHKGSRPFDQKNGIMLSRIVYSIVLCCLYCFGLPGRSYHLSCWENTSSGILSSSKTRLRGALQLGGDLDSCSCECLTSTEMFFVRTNMSLIWGERDVSEKMPMNIPSHRA